MQHNCFLNCSNIQTQNESQTLLFFCKQKINLKLQPIIIYFENFKSQGFMLNVRFVWFFWFGCILTLRMVGYVVGILVNIYYLPSGHYSLYPSNTKWTLEFSLECYSILSLKNVEKFILNTEMWLLSNENAKV